MNIELKTPKEIREHAEKVLELFNSTGKKLYKEIYDACQNELKRRDLQKKSDPQPSENQGRLPQKPELEAWAKKIETEQLQQNQRQEETARAFTQNPVLTAPQPKALTKIPAPTKPIKWANGKVYEMNELDLRRKSVDYFSDVLNGKREPKDFYRSMQFNNLVRFQIGLYRFGNEVMEHKTLHPTFEMCKKETQERSEELYRQVVEYWNQYKNTDIV